MKTIALDFEFMEALNTLDLTRVLATRKYREMCGEASGNSTDVHAAIAQMIEHNRKKMRRDPQGWAAIVATTAQFAAEEPANRSEQITIEETIVRIDDRFRADGANPRERRQS